jgi:hypothetical protein
MPINERPVASVRAVSFASETLEACKSYQRRQPRAPRGDDFRARDGFRGSTDVKHHG